VVILIEKFKKKPPARAVVLIALAGFIKRPQFELNQRLKSYI
jgi:hypothetical protein